MGGGVGVKGYLLAATVNGKQAVPESHSQCVRRVHETTSGLVQCLYTVYFSQQIN